MDYFVLGVGPEALATGFGVGFCVLAAAWLALRGYRLRQEFAIMKLALEKGVASFPPLLPQWLVSLRQGTLILTLGIGLAGVGGVGFWLSSKVVMPASTKQIGDVAGDISASTPDPHEIAPPPELHEPGAALNPGRGGPPAERLRPPPPPPDPQTERWHRARQQETICLSMIGGGIILFLLGLVRIAFVPAERNYAARWNALNERGSVPPYSGS